MNKLIIIISTVFSLNSFAISLKCKIVGGQIKVIGVNASNDVIVLEEFIDLEIYDRTGYPVDGFVREINDVIHKQSSKILFEKKSRNGWKFCKSVFLN